VSPSTTRQTTLRYEDVTLGQSLGELVLPITRTLIVAGALASRDYQDVHHDAELAKGRGSKDIFMNILTTNGLVGRFVTDWTGPGGILRQVSIRLGAPNYADEVMTLTGEVQSKDGVEDDGTHGRVTVSVRGANSLGDHVTGTVIVALPLSGDNGRTQA
jgi:acyl dehydratase